MIDNRAERAAFAEAPAFICPTCGLSCRRVKTLDGVTVNVLASPVVNGDLDVVAWNRRFVWVDLHAIAGESDYDPYALRLQEHKHNG